MDWAGSPRGFCAGAAAAHEVLRAAPRASAIARRITRPPRRQAARRLAAEPGGHFGQQFAILDAHVVAGLRIGPLEHRLVDRVAYINHDIDDAIRHGILRPDDLPGDEIHLLGSTGSARYSE